MSIWNRFQHLLRALHRTPQLLRGSGPTHEQSFEQLLVHHGIFRSPRIGYERHPKGPNRWPDFELYDERMVIPVELKTTSSPYVHMGQTWFQSHGLYIISRHAPVSPTSSARPSVFISFGKEMRTDEEEERYRVFKEDLARFKTSSKKTFTSTAHWTVRTSIRYRLEEERAEERFRSVMETLRRL